MKITLAYEYEGHKPDSTIDVDPVVGKRLIREGRARRAAETVPELRAHAADLGVDLHGARRKDDIEAAVEAAEGTRAQISVLPDDGRPTTEGDQV